MNTLSFTPDEKVTSLIDDLCSQYSKYLTKDDVFEIAIKSFLISVNHYSFSKKRISKAISNFISGELESALTDVFNRISKASKKAGSRSV